MERACAAYGVQRAACDAAAQSLPCIQGLAHARAGSCGHALRRPGIVTGLGLA